VEGTAILISADRTNFDRFFQQSTVCATFHQNKAVFLILEDILVHNVKIVLEHPGNLCRTEGCGQTRVRDLKEADDV
jgi:predicted metalloprotease